MENNRRDFLSSLKAFFAGLFAWLFAGGSASGATKTSVNQLKGQPNTLVGLDASGVGQSVTVGSGLSLSSGLLSLTPSQQTSRSYGMVLSRSSTGTYPLPPSISHNIAVFRNGLRQAPTVDYTITSGAIVPVPEYPWGQDDIVVVDGE